MNRLQGIDNFRDARIGILLKADVEELLEMFATNRQAREVIDYIKEHIPSPPLIST